MSSYVKFIKEILSKKRRLDDFETVALTEGCSAILQRKLPQKLQDLGSFTIPCTIGKFECKHALCDLGASINLMPLSVFRKLCLGEPWRRIQRFPLFLGPFLATGQALIDVIKGEFRLRVQGEEVVFNVFKAMSYPRSSDSCFNVDVIDGVVSKKRITNDPLELALALGDDNEEEEWGLMNIILMEEDSKPSIEAQRRLNPSMKDVVLKQVLNW
ncbi:uncharacterized protein LOC133806336 [Humulus lupulus]|uniref:uncharacterized protein LOC133806336 n=1 Tax=Humulus lupulus TaxID=3486 RepID=UPI002B40AD03|nr:uncharacterized protein LOC133806336 [Humulus lupulus]